MHGVAILRSLGSGLVHDQDPNVTKAADKIAFMYHCGSSSESINLMHLYTTMMICIL
jgi:hypothetical protein